ncbi:MAG: META domain-containing protein [Herpetosiphonaceae bacterium]|nr:META domain-containing protein [Herpetosiphonaceae bacterium]
MASIEQGGRIEHVIGGSDITAEFTDGIIRGASGCNTYGGQFTVTGNRLTVKNVVETQLGCGNQQEIDYLRALDGATSFTLTSDTLTITYAGGALHFTRM